MPRIVRFSLLCLYLVVAAALVGFASPAGAEDGVTADTIVIGQTAGFTGQVAGQVKEMTAAARAYFEYVNRRGGANGRRLVLKSLDDGYDGKRAAVNARKLVVDEKVFALALSRGTPPSEAMLPIVNEHKVPFVGPATGSQSLHEPFSRYVFNVRAKYRTEAVRIINHLASVQSTRIAVVYQDNSFGRDGLAGFDQGLKGQHLEAVAVLPLDGAHPEKDVAGVAEAIAKADPQAVVIAGPLKPTADLIRTLKAKSVFAQCLVLSNLSSDTFIAELGDAAPGVVVTQIVPFPWNAGLPLAKELQQAVRESPESGAVVSYAAMEGLVYAKLIVEGLKSAGKNPTRETFVRALEGFHDYDLGGFAVTFGPRNREGSTYTDITIVGRDKTFLR